MMHSLRPFSAEGAECPSPASRSSLFARDRNTGQLREAGQADREGEPQAPETYSSWLCQHDHIDAKQV